MGATTLKYPIKEQDGKSIRVEIFLKFNNVSETWSCEIIKQAEGLAKLSCLEVEENV